VVFQVTPDDLGTFLGIASIDLDRAYLVLQLSQQLCQTVVTPLPDNATPVVLDVASRAYLNPGSVAAQVAGPFSVGSAPGGIYLTRTNKAALRRLAGGGGGFTIETLPTTAGQNLPWWEDGSIQTDSGTFHDTIGGFDQFDTDS
jgi:hypothetical protein